MTPPVNVETYPRYEYRGSYVYNVNGRYYHRNGNRWMRFNERPRDLDERFAPVHANADVDPSLLFGCRNQFAGQQGVR